MHWGEWESEKIKVHEKRGTEKRRIRDEWMPG